MSLASYRAAPPRVSVVIDDRRSISVGLQKESHSFSEIVRFVSKFSKNLRHHCLRRSALNFGDEYRVANREIFVRQLSGLASHTFPEETHQR